MSETPANDVGEDVDEDVDQDAGPPVGAPAPDPGGEAANPQDESQSGRVEQSDRADDTDS